MESTKVVQKDGRKGRTLEGHGECVEDVETHALQGVLTTLPMPWTAPWRVTAACRLSRERNADPMPVPQPS